jgi:phosphate-selective porin OprO and OprP
MASRWKSVTAVLLTSSAGLAFAGPAAADSASDLNAKIEALEQEIQDLSAQVQDLKRSTSDQYADTQSQQSSAVKVSINNGRPTISSADGDFTAAIRALVQYDTAYYIQSAVAKALPTTYGPDLSSGNNFRRVYLGIQGKVFGDWSYYLNLDFGGSGGTETPGHIQSAYLQYDGLAPWAFRVGAYPPPANIEDGTSSGETIFLERNSPSNLQRSLAGGDGRDAISILYTGDRLFGALSYTGGKVQDSSVFDEQQAVLGRVSYLLYSDSDAHFLIGANGTHVFKLPDLVPNGIATLSTTPGATALNTVTLSDPPELTVDSNGIKLANTGSLTANHLTQWGVEAAGNFQNFYGQAGYYSFLVDRSPVAYKTYTSATTSGTTIVQPSNDTFNAWYVQATWVITGESRPYNATNGAFGAPKPAEPFSFSKGTWGALELAARYSDLNLNDHALDSSSVITNWTGAATRTYTFTNTVRGGDQRIATVGLNWYPNTVVRFALDYQWIDVSRLQSPAAVTTAGTPALPTLNGGQTVQIIAFRAQLSL